MFSLPPEKNIEHQKYIEVGLSTSKKIVFFNESSLQMVKPDFCFILKALFVLEIFRF